MRVCDDEALDYRLSGRRSSRASVGVRSSQSENPTDCTPHDQAGQEGETALAVRCDGGILAARSEKCSDEICHV